MVIFSDITEKECVKKRGTATWKRKFDLCNIARSSQQQQQQQLSFCYILPRHTVSYSMMFYFAVLV